MTKELIENVRAIIVPYMAHDLRRINYENMGEIDAKQFSEDMNEILDLATKALEQECEDAISRKWLKTAIHNFYHGLKHTPTEEDIQAYIDVAPSEQPKYNTSEWCHDCKEYDHDKHCCHRWSNVIRDTVEEMKQQPCGDAISREEAIGAVANLFEMSEYPHPYPQGKPIRLKDIKEKLKQLPPVQPKPIECEDTISRKDALKALDYDIKSFEFKSGIGRHMNEIANLLNTIYEIQSDNIKVLPSVRSKTKTGHWIHTSGYNFHCSECDFIQHESKTEYKYCPNCGCRLVEPQESEDKE